MHVGQHVGACASRAMQYCRDHQSGLTVMAAMTATSVVPGIGLINNPLVAGAIIFGMNQVTDHSAQIFRGCRNQWHSFSEKVNAQATVKHFAAGFGFVFSSILTRGLVNSGNSLKLPNFIYRFNDIACKTNRFFSLGDASISVGLTGPMVEEMALRIILQEGLLKRIPAWILNKTAPSYAPIINRRAAKIARIMVSSALFAIMHAQSPNAPYNTTTFLAHKFVMGLILGGIQEVSGNPLLSVAFHCGNNIVAVPLFVGKPVRCLSDFQ
jgi:membrane protease YdiL (CAAX protease family)